MAEFGPGNAADSGKMASAKAMPHLTQETERIVDAAESSSSLQQQDGNLQIDPDEERRLRLKIDLRLCTIAGLLCSLNLLDSGLISSASVTSLFEDLGLGVGNRYSVSIFIFTISSIAFQLPATMAVRWLGPRIYFSCTTFAFGVITFCTAFIHTWREMIALRVLLGIAMSGIYPGLTYLISTWFTRREQQLRFAYLQTGEVFVLATGTIVNYGLQLLDGRGGLAGWRWMFLVQGLAACSIGVATYFWMVDFPEYADRSLRFLTAAEQELAVRRIAKDRGDVHAEPFQWRFFLAYAQDLKVYGFAVMFFLLNIVSTALNYFLPIILQKGMGFDTGRAIILSSPPYYYAIIPVILSSLVADKLGLRGPIIVFNSCCLIAGFAMLGLADSVAARYIGVFLANGAYISNWAALSAYYQNNITGQWKRAWSAAIITAFNGAGGIAGSFIIRQNEAPRYPTAVWISIGSHILMIGFVCVFTLAFLWSNKRQAAGKRIIENMPGFRHTY